MSVKPGYTEGIPVDCFNPLSGLFGYKAWLDLDNWGIILSLYLDENHWQKFPSNTPQTLRCRASAGMIKSLGLYSSHGDLGRRSKGNVGVEPGAHDREALMRQG